MGAGLLRVQSQLHLQEADENEEDGLVADLPNSSEMRLNKFFNDAGAPPVKQLARRTAAVISQFLGGDNQQYVARHMLSRCGP